MIRSAVAIDYIGREFVVPYTPKDRPTRRLRLGGGKEWYDSITRINLRRNALRGERTMGEKVYRTGQVAKMLQVSPRKVCQWFDAGDLYGYRLPGSNDRRIMRSSLEQFLNRNGMPPLEEINV